MIKRILKDFKLNPAQEIFIQKVIEEIKQEDKNLKYKTKEEIEKILRYKIFQRFATN